MTAAQREETPVEHYRIREGRALCYVTFRVVQWLPVFTLDATCLIVTQSLRFCHMRKHLRINAVVLMPTHFHGIFFDADGDAARLGRTLTDFRKLTGRQLADLCASQLPPCFTQALRATLAEDRERQFWQISRHPEAVYSAAILRQKAEYLHANPCRKGLVCQPDHWRFSSAAYWLSDGQAECDVPLTPVEW